MTPSQWAGTCSKIRRILGEIDLTIAAIDDAQKLVTLPATPSQNKAAKLRRRLYDARLHILDGLGPSKQPE